MAVYLFATLDTKGREAAFLRERLKDFGVDVRLVDAGCQAPPQVAADVPREELFGLIGSRWEDLRDRGDRGKAVAAAAEGAARLARQAFDEGRLTGVIGIGGSAGTTIGTAAMRALPLGVPKLAVSTMASGQVRPYVRDKDILMLNSVADVAGLNRITKTILTQAAAAMAGMVQHGRGVSGDDADRPVIAATMFGVTTPCVERARQVLEAAGTEVLVFHATGTGGQAMESLIEEGLIDGVLDLTITELADELVGGVLSAGPQRLTAAARHGVPQVVSVGATDMVNFGPRDTVPAAFADRLFHQHNPTVTLMRTTPDENAAIGRDLAQKVSRSTGPALILLPAKGVSALDQAGAAFDDPAARRALFAAIREYAGAVPVEERDEHINDAAFAEAAAERLLVMMGQNR